MRLLITTILLLLISFSFSQNHKTLFLKKIPQPVEIDGLIDPIWSTADSVTDFEQFLPYHGQKPSRKTVAKVLTTEEALYSIMICYDDYKNIQKNTGKLDDFGGDVVSIMLDTFGDRRTAYKFGVSAAGVQSDSRLLDDARNRDYSWDGIWFADAKVYDWGFVVEMEIPYKSIQYDSDLREWGLDFDRWIPSLSEDIYWCSYSESEGQRISKFGKLLFTEFYPSIKGMNLEIYPVGISKATYLNNNNYAIDPNAGIDIFYNPSSKLTFQLTANPDFAQIEADPFEFNISRYETYFNERRPFFTEGNEIFMASGRQRNTGFYRPLELFYSRRIGKKLADGTEVPLIAGTKAFGRINDWEYGGFLALTGKTDYLNNDLKETEPQATFGSFRFKKQILENSSIGLLYVGKYADRNHQGVLDIDGAFRTSDWQLAYQVARSFNNSESDYAGSAGFTLFRNSWIALVRGRYIGSDFEINQVGFVPWKGTAELVAIGGPRWYFEKGYIRSILIYAGPVLDYEKVDSFTDHGAVLGFNMQLRNNWGYEVNLSTARSRDRNIKFNSYDATLSSWYHISPKWSGNLYGGYSKTYNFARNFLAFYSWGGSEFHWQTTDVLELGTSASAFIEGNPDGNIEDITYNSRPYLSVTPINNLNIRIYFDNIYVRSTGRFERLLMGFLFAYNFSPKSWIYFALNEVRDRSERFDSMGNTLPNRMHLTDRVGVFKVKYLYYF